ncbi:interleukin-18-like [Discoglossus pictus]
MNTCGAGEFFEVDDTDLIISHEDKRGILYFEEPALQTDSFRISNRSLTVIIKNCFQEALEAHPEEFSECAVQFCAQYDKDRVQFKLQRYRNTNLYDGLSVAFTIKFGQKKYFMYCTSEKKLSFKEGDCPNSIEQDTSDIIFYQKAYSERDNEYCIFESALGEGYCLAFQIEDGKHKLILKPNAYDQHDHKDESVALGVYRVKD